MTALSDRTLGELDARVAVPAYDRAAVTASVVHLGVGGFHRAHQAVFHDDLLAAGARDLGICGIGVLEQDAPIRDALRAQDGLYTVVVKHPDGTTEPRVVGALVDYLLAPDDPDAAIERLAAPATRLMTLTITEGGYNVDDASGAFGEDDPGVRHDLEHPDAPRTAFGLVVEALRRRRERGHPPFTILSCDNLPGNGDVARTAFAAFARLRDPDLGAWVEREVPFPSTVVDRITPATTDDDRAALAAEHGIEDAAPVVCEPFVQWVVERPDGAWLPAYGDVGARLVDDARPYELMKLRLLNAGHQAVAYLGLLLGLRHVHEAVADDDLGAFLAAYLDEEAAPTLTGVPADELAAFRDAIPERFGNAAIADTLERLAAHSADRLPKFVLPVLRERLARDEPITRGAAILAAWTRQTAPEDPRAVLRDLADAEAYRSALATLDADGPRALLR